MSYSEILLKMLVFKARIIDKEKGLSVGSTKPSGLSLLLQSENHMFHIS
jgi:hypothetical protein